MAYAYAIWVYHKYDVPRNKAPAFANLMKCA